MRLTRNDILAALAITPALAAAVWLGFWLRHGETIAQSLGQL